jgi:hypothetical protein
MRTTKEQPLPHTEPIRHRIARGRNRVRRTIRRAIEAGRVRTDTIAGSVSAHLAGRATRPLAVIPVPVRDASAPFVREASGGGCSWVWVVSPSATQTRQG